MSEGSEEIEGNTREDSRKHSVCFRTEVFAAIIGAVVLVLFSAYWIGRDVGGEKRDWLEAQLKECQGEYDTLLTKLDALGYATDVPLDRYVLAPTVFCSRRTVPILEGEVILGLVGASIYDDIAVFTIYNNITKQELEFRAPKNLTLEFQHRDHTYIVYFLGFEKKDQKACAKVSVGRKSK